MATMAGFLGTMIVLLLGSSVLANPLEGCHNSLKPICNVEWPSSQCCHTLKELSRPCLCNAMKHDVSFALPTLAKHCGTPIQCHGFRARHSKPIHGGFSVEMGLELGGVERQCRDERLESCYSDVDQGRRPSRECCNDLHRIPGECVCRVINRESRLSSPQYIERSLRLPRQCGIRVDCRDEEVEEEEQEEEEDEPEARIRLGLRVRGREEEEQEEEEEEQRRREEEQEAERRRREEEEGGREEGGGRRRQEQQEEECRQEEQVSLQSCYEVIQSPTASPPPSCCNALRQLRAPCRIRAIRRDPLLRQHPERASRLLQQCSLDARS